jgi:tRNA/rRNA methyltransferase
MKLDNVKIVLDEPQNLVNVGGIVRAMKNMGLSHLRVVNPAEWDPWRITGIAHRCDDIVEGTGHHLSLDEAVADCVLVLGTSARSRTAQRNYGWVRDWAPRILASSAEGPVAVVFGREDRGLSNEALDRCDGVVMVPTDPGYSSLNLAQACLIIAYELLLASAAAPETLPKGKRNVGPADRETLESMFQALEQGLHRIDFFSARTPENVMRTVRTLISRAQPDVQEAGIMRSMGYEIRNQVDRLQAQVDRLEQQVGRLGDGGPRTED